MTAQSHKIKTEAKLVVFFDMCSSSSIIEDLKSTDNLGAMRNLLIKVKEFLAERRESVGYEVYKFLGDGWILLFPESIRGEPLIHFLEELSAFFHVHFKKFISRRLQLSPPIIGLKFGIDSGVLIRIRMMDQTEYIGRALNVASRLQSAIGDKDRNPAYKCLLSRHTFLKLRLPSHEHRIKEVSRTLRNIQGGERYRCIKLTLNLLG